MLLILEKKMLLNSKENVVLMEQIERVEALLAQLGAVHDRGFTKWEKEILEGLQSKKKGLFERAPWPRHGRSRWRTARLPAPAEILWSVDARPIRRASRPPPQPSSSSTGPAGATRSRGSFAPPR